MVPTKVLALCAFALTNFAAGSTVFSSDVAPVKPTDAVTSVVYLTTTVCASHSGHPHPSHESSSAAEPLSSSSVASVTVPESPPASAPATVIVSSIVTVSSTPVVTGPISSVESGFMTIQTSTPVGNGTAPVIDSSAVSFPSVGTSTYHPSTIVHTTTANKTTAVPSGPTASASKPPPEVVNAAAGVKLGALALAGALAAGVFGA
ncbi:hypothetical protein ACN47E_007485 [Coniothyrium glycines]